ncbi:hypothetical protein BpHYR1_033472, partial [Brachionus plicatilis]
MAFINLLKTNSCVNSCTADSFYSLNDSAGNQEAKINFVQQYIQKTSPILDFSCYKAIDEKFKKLLSQFQLSSLFKNEEMIYSELMEKRIVLSGCSKDEVKKKKNIPKLDREKSKKRSAQLAEISVIYEENEPAEKKQEEVNFHNQIKKLYKEKQTKLLKKQQNFDSDKLNLIPEEKKNPKKIRLSDEIDSNSKIKGRKKSSEKTRKSKMHILKSNVAKSVKKEEPTSFIDQIEKIDKAKGITTSKNLKTSFKFTPSNKTICISKIPNNDTSASAVKKTNSNLSNSYQFKPPVAKNPTKVPKTITSKAGFNGLLSKPKNKVKEMIEKFSNITKSKKKLSPILSSNAIKKTRNSLTKKEVKRKSTHFVKDIVKEIDKTVNGSKSVNTSIQSQKIVNAVKKNPLVVNHKVGNSRPIVANNSVSKTPNRQKVTQTTFRINQLNKKINPDDLKYDSNRCKLLMEAAKKKMADERIKRIGSTSTVSSLDCSQASLSSLKQEQQSFKSVNSTFDSVVKSELKNGIKKNTTFSIKPNNNSVIPKQKVPFKPQVISHNQKDLKSEMVKTNQVKKPRPL